MIVNRGARGNDRWHLSITLIPLFTLLIFTFMCLTSSNRPTCLRTRSACYHVVKEMLLWYTAQFFQKNRIYWVCFEKLLLNDNVQQARIFYAPLKPIYYAYKSVIFDFVFLVFCSFWKSMQHYGSSFYIRDHSFSTYAKYSEKLTFRTL